MSRIHITKDIIVDMDSCDDNFTCIHDVIINGKSIRLNGRSIYNLIRKNNAKIPPHFSC